MTIFQLTSKETDKKSLTYQKIAVGIELVNNSVNV